MARCVRATSSVTGSSTPPRRTGPSPAGGGPACGSRPCGRSPASARPAASASGLSLRTTYRCHAGRAAGDGDGQRDELAEPRVLVVRPQRGGARRPSASRCGSCTRRIAACSESRRRVVADVLVGDLVPRAVEAQHPHAVGELVVAGGDGAAVAEAAEVLGREEAERSDRAQRAGPAVARGRARGLGGVLDDRHAERLDLGDRRDVAEQVHRDDRLGARRQRGLDRLGGDAERVRIDVAEHGPRAGRRDRLGARRRR